jgi:hypothetical protein
MTKYSFDMSKIYPDNQDPIYHEHYTNWQGKPATRFNDGAYNDDRSAAFKKVMKTFAREQPHVMHITKSGNGANVNVGDLHIGSQGTSTLAFNMPAASIWFRMGYTELKSIEIDTHAKLVVLNGRVALRYEN